MEILGNKNLTVSSLKLLYLLTIFLFLVFQLNAQNDYVKKVDSVVNQVNLDFDDQSDKAETIKSLINFLKQYEVEKSIEVFNYTAGVIHEDLTIDLYTEWARSLSARAQPGKALEIAEQGLALATRKRDKKNEVNLRIQLCYLNLFSNKPDVALEHINRAEALALEVTDDVKFKSIHYNKAMVYDQLNDFDKATEYYLKAWEAIDKDPNDKERGFFLYVLTDYFKRANLVKEHTVFIDQLVKHYSNNLPVGPKEHLPLSNLISMDTSSASINYYKSVLKMSDSLGTVNSFVQTSHALSEIYLHKEENDRAIAILKDALKKLSGEERKFQKSVINLKLSDAYKANNDFENAYKYLDAWSLLNEEVNSERMKGRVAQLEVEYQTSQKEREIEKQQFELEKKQANQKLLLWITSFSGLLLLTSLYWFFKIRRKNSLLDKQKTILEKTVDEKNVLLKEVHHRVKNSFQIVSSLLFLQSKNIKDKEAQLAIKEAQNRVRSMVLIHQKLYSKDQLVGINTEDYFTDLTKDIFDSHQDKSKGISFSLDIEPMVLGIETITPIGLILNELIVNVLKHAFETVDEKSAMQIKFKAHNDTLQLTVLDNGKGFVKDSSTSSFGIKLIKALAKKLKADLMFNSKEGLGTEAILNISKFEIL